MKLHQLLTATAFVSNDWLASPRVQWLAVGWESALALWLWSGWRSNVCRWVGLLTFAVFAAVSLHEGVAGKRTCCCFGAVQAQPWFILVLDLIVLAWLLRVGPTKISLELSVRPFRVVAMAIGFLCMAASIGAAAFYWPTDSQVRVLDWPKEALVINQSGRAKWEFRLFNSGNKTLELKRLQTSCECFSIETFAVSIPPLQSIAASAFVAVPSDFVGIESQLEARAFFEIGGSLESVFFRREMRVESPNPSQSTPRQGVYHED